MDERTLYSLLGRYRVSKRQKVTRACAVCGNPVEGLRTRMYCGPTCNQRAYRRRLREQHGP